MYTKLKRKRGNTRRPRLRFRFVWFCFLAATTSSLPLVSAEPDIPHFQQRASHLGWEVRTKHFVVVATTTRRDALRTAQIMTAAWQEAATLSDHWTDLHRRETFGDGAVVAWVVDGVRRGREPVFGEGRPSQYADKVFIDLSDGSIEDRVVQLRRKTVDAFMRVSEQDRALPQWVRTGLAAYVAGEQPESEGFQRLEPPRPDVGSPDAAQSALWVRYLLEADDARYATRFFEAMATAIADRPRTAYEAERPRRITRGVTPDRVGGLPAFEQLITTPEILEGTSQWLSDPMSGQPIVEFDNSEQPPDERHRRMALILKLMQRFSTETKTPAGIKVREFKSGAAVEWIESARDAPTDVPSVMSVAQLRSRLRTAPRWATIDTNGRLLVSDDSQRLAEVLGASDPDITYRTFVADGHTVLEATFARSGETYQASLEENPENPSRPIARVRR